MDGTLNGTDSISVFFFFVKHNLINLDYVLRGYIPLQWERSMYFFQEFIHEKPLHELI